MDEKGNIREILKESRTREHEFARSVLELADKSNLTWAEFERSIALVKELGRVRTA